MHEHTIKGALKELKGQILNTWETLADAELEKAKENVTQLSSHFHEKLDQTKVQISDRVSGLLSRFNAGFEQVDKTSARDEKSSTPHN